MQEQELKNLLKRIQNGTATDEEKAFLESWYLQYRDENGAEYSINERVEDADAIWAVLSPGVTLPLRSKLWPRVAAAAAILLFVSIGGYFITHKKATQANLDIAKNDIAPGSSKAVLHLANGKKIILTDAKNGTLAHQNNTVIKKTDIGQIVYNTSNGPEGAAKTVYDTLTTPRAGIWHIALADGSVVWLNAATSIRYPEKFIGKERVVKVINGEAYFDVRHDATKPFKVEVTGQTIEDIGTHFNVNAYKDEPQVTTTLLEGAVRVSGHRKAVILKPGQQAQTGMYGGIKVLDNADMEETIAWKNGDFIFKDEDFKATMRKIARWYDVDVVYDASVPLDFMPGGWISRSKNISAVLRIMELTRKVHFKVEGRRIIITK